MVIESGVPHDFHNRIAGIRARFEPNALTDRGSLESQWKSHPEDREAALTCVRDPKVPLQRNEDYGCLSHGAHARRGVCHPEQHGALLVDAGCHDVDVLEDKPRGWICAIGRV
jgi:hypothetical protein